MSYADSHFRTLAAVERAVVSGHFNIAKVLRATAHVQRTVALAEARTETGNVRSSEALNEFLNSQSGSQLAAEQNRISIERMSDIARRSLKSLERNEDVSESDVAQSLWGCTNCGNVIEGEQPDVCDLCGALSPEFTWFGPYFSGTVSGNLKPEVIVEILESAANEVAEVVAHVDDASLSRRPEPGEWSAKETLAHMLETDNLFATRIDYLLDGDSSKGWPRPMPPWKLHEGKGYNEMPISSILEKYAANRDYSLSILRSLSPTDWSTQVGANSLLALGTWASTHDRGHLEQLRRACGKA